MNKVDHPRFMYFSEPINGISVAIFAISKVGVTALARQFDAAARALIKKFEAELAAIPGLEEHRSFGGGIMMPRLEYICAKKAANRFTDDEVSAMRAALLAANPDAQLVDEWHNQSNGWPGYSFRVKEPS